VSLIKSMLRNPRFGARDVIRRRPKPTTFDNTGKAITGFDEDTFRAIVQPASRDAAKFLPEGTRLDEVRVFWSDAPIGVGDSRTTEPDVLIDCGTTYRVLYAEPRPADGGYYRAWAEATVA
jgi:hypothetical protein